MLIAATTEVQVALARLIIKIHVGIDDGIFGIEDRTVIKILEGTSRRVAYSYANLEVLSLVGRVLLVVGTEEHIVFTVALIHLWCPEAVNVPLIGLTSLIDASAGFPLAEVITYISLETIFHRGAVHVVPAVAGMQQEGISELQGQRVTP
jgi:hypothetical protein